jgi:6-phosphogluconolactonase (cycloisomerase 2 family)
MDTYCYVGNRKKIGKMEGPLGISICRYDEAVGSLSVIGNVAPEINAGFLFIDRDVLYCVDERPNLPGMRIGGGGQVYAFAINPATALLTELNHQPAFGTMPTYIISSGDHILLVNHATKNQITVSERDNFGKFRIKVLFDASSLVLYQRLKDGSVGELLDVWASSGDGPIDEIQYSSHLHSVVASPSGKLFSVCDKGADRIYMLRIEKNRLAVAGKFKTNPGYAPRYSAFHPTRSFLFVNNEFQPYIDTFRYDEDGKLENAGCVMVLPKGVENPAKHGQSDILVSPNGEYIYDLFRHINMIFVFRIDQETGELTRIQSFQSEGKTLRSCILSPDGHFLLVAADESRNVLTYPVNLDGTLGPSIQSLTQAGPAHLVFNQRKNSIHSA